MVDNIEKKHNLTAIEVANWVDDARRNEVRDMIRNSDDAYLLGKLHERDKNDADLSLEALAKHPEAMMHVSDKLRNNHNWAREAMARNWRALQYLPTKMRSDRSVVLAAAQQDQNALEFALGGLRADDALRNQAMAGLGPQYDGEALRLVGDFNDWRMRDAACRFRKLKYKFADSDEIGGPPPANGCVRHRIVCHLQEGVVCFQINSCLRNYGLRIYPDPYAGSNFRLQPGYEPTAVPANVGTWTDGFERNFYIQERKGSIVCIFVEIMEGAMPGGVVDAFDSSAANSGRAAAVWYTVAGKGVRYPEIIPMRQKIYPGGLDHSRPSNHSQVNNIREHGVPFD